LAEDGGVSRWSRQTSIDKLWAADFMGHLKIEGMVMSARWPFLFLSAFVWLLGSSISTRAEEWKPQSYPADGFQVEFSGPVTVNETAMSDETRQRVVRATNYLQDNGTSAYFVAAMLVKDSVNFNGGATDFFAVSKCQAKEETPLTLIGAEKGIEIRGSSCLGNGSHFEERFFQRGKWFYQVTAIYLAGGDAEAARHFLNSFKLLWQAELLSRPVRLVTRAGNSKGRAGWLKSG
jgi:hypothetical protein